MTENEIQAGINSYKHWYHRIPLPFGLTTPGIDKDVGDRWERIKKEVPSLQGKKILDVGAWDGFYSFMAEREGASVLATDHVMWSGSGWGNKQGFDFIKKALGSTVAEKDIDVHEISVDSVGKFDVVFFLNVLYHLQNPYQCFQQVASVSTDMLLIETLIDLRIQHEPYFRFIPDRLLNDPTNWFVPNDAAVVAMIENAKFEVVKKWISARMEVVTAEGMARMTYLARRQPKITM